MNCHQSHPRHRLRTSSSTSKTSFVFWLIENLADDGPDLFRYLDRAYITKPHTLSMVFFGRPPFGILNLSATSFEINKWVKGPAFSSNASKSPLEIQP